MVTWGLLEPGGNENEEGNSPAKKNGVYGQKKERKAEKARTTNISYKMESHFPPIRYVPVFYTIKRKKNKK